MKYYLDTNIVIYAVNGKFPKILKHMEDIPSQSIVIPSIVMAEIEYGIQKCKNYHYTLNKYSKFTDVFQKESFTNSMAKTYGKIRALLEKGGKIIGPNDLIIASQVIHNDGILVTHNINEFSRISGLKFEDWTQ